MLTPAFVADHLALLEPEVKVDEKTTVASQPRNFVTLTGLRGVINGYVALRTKRRVSVQVANLDMLILCSSELVVLSCGNALVESPTGLLKPGSLSPADFADETVHR